MCCFVKAIHKATNSTKIPSSCYYYCKSMQTIVFLGSIKQEASWKPLSWNNTLKS